MKKSTTLLIAGFCLLIGGAALSYHPLMEYWRSKQAVTALNTPFATAVHAQVPATPSAPEQISGKPVRLQIPAAGIDLVVAEGRFNTVARTWTLSKDKAHYAVNTPLANNTAGNTLIYGHNRANVLRTLNRVKVGDEAVVTAENGRQFHYRFSAAYETHRDDTSVFDYQGLPILTVQTCSGLRFENRQLFIFTFERVT